MGFSAEQIRQDFPMFERNSSLVFLDSGASSQKPASVIERLSKYYCEENANIHRGIYQLSEKATAEFENTRAKVASFIGAKSKEEIIFTRGTTESINIVALSWGAANLTEKDEIVLTVAEHHSNIVPWQILQAKIGFKISYIGLDAQHRVNLEQARSLITPRTKLVGMSHVSNVLGFINPVREIVELAKKVGAKTLIDGAQGAAHLDVDVMKLDCDFYCFSAHKLLGPTGVGVLYGKKALLDEMPPYHGGGDMIESVSLEGSVWNEVPHKFEAGTPNIAGVIGTGAALDYLSNIDRKAALAHDKELGLRLLDGLKSFNHVRTFVADSSDWVGIVTFAHAKIHAHDLAALCDKESICVRAGHHCAMPLMKVLGERSTVRASPYVYNIESDIDALIGAIRKAEEIFL